MFIMKGAVIVVIARGALLKTACATDSAFLRETAAQTIMLPAMKVSSKYCQFRYLYAAWNTANSEKIMSVLM